MPKGDWTQYWTEGVAVYNSYTKARFGVVASVEGSMITIKRKSGEVCAFSGEGIAWNRPTSYRILHSECAFIHVNSEMS